MLNFWNQHYLFLVVGLGVSLLSMAAAMIGSSLVFQKQSQLGDAIGHAAYPGIIAAFMVTQSRNPFTLLLGAVASGILVLILIHFFSKEPAFHFESILALVLSTLFGLGMVLMSYIQGNDNYQGASQAGLKTYIMGQAAFLKQDDVILIALVSSITILIFFMALPRIKLSLFDPVFAASIGIDSRKLSLLNLSLAVVVISVGLKAVGAILIAALLITPTIIGMQWSRNYQGVLWVAVGSAVVGSLFGTWLSTVVDKLATGPSVVLTLFFLAWLSFIIGPQGLIAARGYQHD